MAQRARPSLRFLGLELIHKAKPTAKMYEAVRSISVSEQMNTKVRTVKLFMNTLYSPISEKSKR